MSDQAPTLPDSPASCERRTRAEIGAEIRRIREQPGRLDRLSAFASFAKGECYPLIEHGTRPGFVVQHAFNHAPDGPVHDIAMRLVPLQRAPLLIRRWLASATWNPRPACLQTLAGHSSGVTSVSVTPDGRRAVSGSKDETVRV